MDHKLVKNDTPSKAESCNESYKHSQRALLRQRLSVSTKYYFKLGKNATKPGVSENPRDLDNKKRCERNCLRSSSHRPKKSADCKTKNQNFSLRSVIIECQAMLKGKKDHKVNKYSTFENYEHTVDDSHLEGASRKKFEGVATHPNEPSGGIPISQS